MSDGRPVWLVLADPLSTRIFIDCGIAERLEEHYGARLQPVFLFDREEAAAWASRLQRPRRALPE